MIDINIDQVQQQLSTAIEALQAERDDEPRPRARAEIEARRRQIESIAAVIHRSRQMVAHAERRVSQAAARRRPSVAALAWAEAEHERLGARDPEGESRDPMLRDRRAEAREAFAGAVRYLSGGGATGPTLPGPCVLWLSRHNADDLAPVPVVDKLLMDARGVRDEHQARLDQALVAAAAALSERAPAA